MNLSCRLAAVTALAIALFALSGITAQAKMDAAMKEGIATIPFGNMVIFAIQDRPGDMDAGLFSGPATAAERSALMPNGKAPAGINVFVIKSGDKTILVDSGWGVAAPGESALLPSLKALGLTPASIDLILLTHMHGDHVGGLVADSKAVFPKATLLAAKTEKDSWLSPENIQQGKEGKNPTAQLALGVQKAYGDRFMTFAAGEAVAPGVTAVPVPGHTPGHTAFLVESDGKKLLIIGDLIHAAALQFPKPDECARYDMDPALAVQSRKALLTRAAKENIPVAGMHLPFPATGSVTIKADGGFTFTQQ